MKPLEMAFVRFTSCSGCQLMLLNCEERLASLDDQARWCDFAMLSSRRDGLASLDVALVEGAVSTTGELEELLSLRRRSRLLVAVGACALTGGVNRLARADRGGIPDSFPPQPLHRFVTVDGKVPGCPPERNDLLALFGALRSGGWPAHLECAVCMECRIGEFRCLLQMDHLPCLGPVTLGGCRARCPAIGVPCEGCRGDVAEAQRDELFRLLVNDGVPAGEIRRRMTRFEGSDND